MTEKKKNILSLAMDEEMQQCLKKVAAARNISVSSMVRNILQEKLALMPIAEEEKDTIVFKIPHSVKASEDELRAWLGVRMDSIVNQLILWPVEVVVKLRRHVADDSFVVLYQKQKLRVICCDSLENQAVRLTLEGGQTIILSDTKPSDFQMYQLTKGLNDE